MALQVAEKNFDKKSLLLIGIKENGIFIADAIGKYLKEYFTGSIEVISLELNKKMPGEIKLSSPLDFNEKNILLIDDVANSGRTMLYAIKPLLAQYPAQLETLVLVERTHKLFPVAINYNGMSVSSTLQQNIVVQVKNAEIQGAYISELVNAEV